MKLWKTKIIIWSDFDPQQTALEDLARDAVSGGSLCTEQKHEHIQDVEKDADWNGSEFFGEEEKGQDSLTAADYATLKPIEQISFLAGTFRMSIEEAQEIRTDDIYGLPLEIAEGFNDFDDAKYPDENRP